MQIYKTDKLYNNLQGILWISNVLVPVLTKKNSRYVFYLTFLKFIFVFIIIYTFFLLIALVWYIVYLVLFNYTP